MVEGVYQGREVSESGPKADITALCCVFEVQVADYELHSRHQQRPHFVMERMDLIPVVGFARGEDA